MSWHTVAWDGERFVTIWLQPVDGGAGQLVGQASEASGAEVGEVTGLARASAVETEPALVFGGQGNGLLAYSGVDGDGAFMEARLLVKTPSIAFTTAPSTALTCDLAWSYTPRVEPSAGSHQVVVWAISPTGLRYQTLPLELGCAGVAAGGTAGVALAAAPANLKFRASSSAGGREATRPTETESATRRR